MEKIPVYSFPPNMQVVRDPKPRANVCNYDARRQMLFRYARKTGIPLRSIINTPPSLIELDNEGEIARLKVDVIGHNIYPIVYVGEHMNDSEIWLWMMGETQEK